MTPWLAAAGCVALALFGLKHVHATFVATDVQGFVFLRMAFAAGVFTLSAWLGHLAWGLLS